jgi:peptide-methionine (S)-S-oxide reductase
MKASEMPESITLGGGCFWCLEAVYLRMKGVTSAVSGYMGGHVDGPSYEEVCQGTTGHAEVVQVTFDPAVTTLEEILDVFFTIHDPTTKDRQGNDIGPQYRSVIFYHSEAQRATAQLAIAAQARLWRHPIVTELTGASRFYPAELYHQDYFNRNPGQGYCRWIVAPKVEKFVHAFPDKATPP